MSVKAKTMKPNETKLWCYHHRTWQYVKISEQPPCLIFFHTVLILLLNLKILVLKLFVPNSFMSNNNFNKSNLTIGISRIHYNSKQLAVHKCFISGKLEHHTLTSFNFGQNPSQKFPNRWFNSIEMLYLQMLYQQHRGVRFFLGLRLEILKNTRPSLKTSEDFQSHSEYFTTYS